MKLLGGGRKFPRLKFPPGSLVTADDDDNDDEDDDDDDDDDDDEDDDGNDGDNDVRHIRA